ncbi:hexokinase-7 [Coccidioides immitis RMSCC 3703]|uniref:Phosphotransferase n=1 Tax=Coccidioides immitis RMSCC 3703 TaxID=454286 RepID=A0A0J8QSU7_COCIT|nr:hexokinase-7 [Coccidioides immitis RMSCC 3703]
MADLEGQRESDAPSIKSFLAPLVLDDAKVYDISYRLSEVFRDLARTGDGHFFPTPVTHLPSGKETGFYLAVDVGVTNLRVAFIELLGDSSDSPGNGSSSMPTAESYIAHNAIPKVWQRRVRRTLEKAWRIEEHLKEDPTEELFSWIGSCIADVVADELTSHSSEFPAELETGLSFSLPMKQKSLSEATLMPVGKAFFISEDLDLRQTLLAGYERHTRRTDLIEPTAKRQKIYELPKLKIVAITNDTVATLVSLAYSVKSLPNTRVAMGIIVGAGCNATVPMKLSDLHESKVRQIRSYNPDATEAIINTEWTLRGTETPLQELGVVTKWDVELDSKTHRPGFQPFEYMTGARYIGELVRIIVFDYFTNVAGISKQDLPQTLTEPYSLTTALVSDVIATSRSDITLASDLARSLPPPTSSSWSWTPESAVVMGATVSAVQTRSAALIAAASVGLLACNHEIKLSEKPGSTSGSPTSTQPTGQNPQDQPEAICPGSGWHSGPEELVVAYTGGIIQHYPNFKEMCQVYIDRLIMRGGPQEEGKSVFLREASDGSIIGAGVLAGMVSRK